MITSSTNLDAAIAHLVATIQAMSETAVDYLDARMPGERDQVLRHLYTMRCIRIDLDQLRDQRRG